MIEGAKQTFAWANWSARYCLPLLLERLGERALADTARSTAPITDAASSDRAFAVLRGISDCVCDRFGRGTEHASATVVSTLTLAEISEVGGSDVGWLVSRARYDASRLAEHAIAFGVTDDVVAEVASERVTDPPPVP